MKKEELKNFSKSKEGLRRYFSFLKENGLSNKILWFTIVFRLLTSGMEIASIGLLIPLAKGIIAQDFGFVVDSAVSDFVLFFFPWLPIHDFFTVFSILTLIIFLLTLSKVIITYYGNLFLTAQRLEIASNANQYIFNKYLGLGMPFYAKGEGSSESYFFLRFALIVRSLLDSFDKVIDVGINFVSLSFAMLFISPTLYIIALFLLPVVLLVNNSLKNRIKASIELDDESEQAFPIAINNAFLRLPLAFIYNKEGFEMQEFELNSKDFEKKRLEYEKRISLIQPVNEIMILLLLLVFTILIGKYYINQSLDVARGLVFFYAFQRFIAIGKNLVMALYVMMRPTMRIKKAFDVIEKYTQYSVPSGKKEFTGLQEAISLQNLSFSYPGKKQPVLKNVNLTIRKGQITSIIGKTGSGKSSLVKLLLRLFDCPPGTIFLDNVDIRAYSNTSVRNHISFVNQDPLLFKSSIYKNVIYGATRPVGKQEVRKILLDLGLRKMFQRLDNGVDSEVTEMGTNLSGGEKQIIALARSLLNETEIVIFDEPTSSLDALTESGIKKVMDAYSIGKTVILIAHRLSTIKGTHHIAVMEDGKIIEEGDLTELLQENSRFREYWEVQRLD